MRMSAAASACLALMLAGAGTLVPSSRPRSVFSKDNLVAWAIVPYDAAKRTPDERARMLKRLGITMLAYDWRERHIPFFDEEADALQRHGIKMQAFWLPSGPQPRNEKSVQIALDFVKRRAPGTQIWYVFTPPKNFGGLSEDAKLEMAAAAVRYVAGRAEEFHSKVGMYSMNEWYREPENLLAIVKRLKLRNLGIVYNFHHGIHQIDRFPQFYPRILPHLLAINLNGMKKQPPNVPLPFFIPIGEGDHEAEMIRIIRKSKYRGVISLPGGHAELDAEVSLKGSMAGLQKVLKQIGDEEALRTY